MAQFIVNLLSNFGGMPGCGVFVFVLDKKFTFGFGEIWSSNVNLTSNYFVSFRCF